MGFIPTIFIIVFAVVNIVLFLYTLVSLIRLKSLWGYTNFENLGKEEKRVFEQKRNLEILIDSLPIGIFEVDEKCKVKYVNQYGLNMCERTYDDLKAGFSLFDMVVGEDLAEAKANFARRLKGEKLENKEYTAITKNGREFPVIINNIPVFSSTGQNRVFGYAMDVSDIKKTEEELREINEQLEERVNIQVEELMGFNEGLIAEINERKQIERKLLSERAFLDKIIQYNPYAIMVVDKDGYPVRFNDAFANLFGAPPYEGYCLFEDPVVKQTGGKEIILNLKEHGVSRLPELRYEAGGLTEKFPGMLVHVSPVAFTICDEEDNVENIVVVYEDIIDLKNAEEILIGKVEFLQKLIDSIPHPVFYKDSRKVYIGCNSAFEELTGMSKDFIIGRKDKELFKNEAECSIFSMEEKDLLENRGVKSYEAVLKDSKGKEMNLIFTKASFTDTNNETSGIIGTIVNITQQKDIEKEQEKLLKKLAKVNEELRSFASIVSHDLKAPLRSIGTLAHWITADNKDRLSEEGWEQMNLLKKRVKRMYGLVEGILEHSRISRVKEGKKEINTYELVKNIVDILIIPDNIHLTIDKNLPVLMFEETRLRQVFQNLIENAVKFMDKEEGEIEVGVMHNKETAWIFYVKDTGPGISEKYHEKIFQMFQTLVPRDEFESTGVGLAIVKKIIELYRGKVWVESKKGEGSTFYFSIPKRKA